MIKWAKAVLDTVFGAEEGIDSKPRLTYDDIKNLPDPIQTTFEANEMDLNIDESWIVDRLGEAWNDFLALPVYNQDDVDDFRKAIHDAQRIVLSRSGWRQLRPNQEVLDQREAELDRQLTEMQEKREADYRDFHGMPNLPNRIGAPQPSKTYSPQTTGSGKAAKPPRK